MCTVIRFLDCITLNERVYHFFFALFSSSIIFNVFSKIFFPYFALHFSMFLHFTQERDYHRQSNKEIHRFITIAFHTFSLPLTVAFSFFFCQSMNAVIFNINIIHYSHDQIRLQHRHIWIWIGKSHYATIASSQFQLIKFQKKKIKFEK